MSETPTGLPIPDQAPTGDPVFQCKQDLVDSMRLFAAKGLAEGVSGHISVVDPGNQSLFWVNPFGVPFNKVTQDDLICVDGEGNVVSGKNGHRVNPSAYAIHSELHRLGHHAVAHSHGRGSRTLGALNQRLLPLDQESAAFYAAHNIYEQYNGPATSREQGKSVADAVGSDVAIILRHHGLITVGENLPEAVFRHVSFERCAELQISAQAAGEVFPMTDEQAMLARRGFNESGFNTFSFQMFVEEHVR